MPLRLMMDVHVKAAVTKGLRVRGVDVLTAQEDGTALLADTLLLNRAAELERVLFTQDRDFLAIAAQRQAAGVSFSGIIFAEQSRVPIGQCIEELELIAKVFDQSELDNELKRLPI